MPTRYSHSADTLCLSIRALRLSGEEAPPHSGSLLSPGAARWNHVGWSCVHKKTRPQGAGMSGLPPGPPQCFRHTWRNSIGHLHCGSEFSVSSTQKGWNLSIWLSHSTNFTQVMLCSTAGRGEDGGGSELVPVLYYSFSQNLNGSGLAVSSHTQGTLPSFFRQSFLRLHWLSTSQNAKRFHMHQLVSASWLHEIGRAHIINQHRFTGERLCSTTVIMSFIDSLPVISQGWENLVTWQRSYS